MQQQQSDWADFLAQEEQKRREANAQKLMEQLSLFKSTAPATTSNNLGQQPALGAPAWGQPLPSFQSGEDAESDSEEDESEAERAHENGLNQDFFNEIRTSKPASSSAYPHHPNDNLPRVQPVQPSYSSSLTPSPSPYYSSAAPSTAPAGGKPYSNPYAFSTNSPLTSPSPTTNNHAHTSTIPAASSSSTYSQPIQPSYNLHSVAHSSSTSLLDSSPTLLTSASPIIPTTLTPANAQPQQQRNVATQSSVQPQEDSFTTFLRQEVQTSSPSLASSSSSCYPSSSSGRPARPQQTKTDIAEDEAFARHLQTEINRNDALNHKLPPKSVLYPQLEQEEEPEEKYNTNNNNSGYASASSSSQTRRSLVVPPSHHTPLPPVPTASVAAQRPVSQTSAGHAENYIYPQSLAGRINYAKFLVKTDTMRLRFHNWLQSMWFTPPGFMEQLIKGSIGYAYIPFWIFDVHVETIYYGEVCHMVPQTSGASIKKGKMVESWSSVNGRRTAFYGHKAYCACINNEDRALINQFTNPWKFEKVIYIRPPRTSAPKTSTKPKTSNKQQADGGWGLATKFFDMITEGVSTAATAVQPVVQAPKPPDLNLLRPALEWRPFWEQYQSELKAQEQAEASAKMLRDNEASKVRNVQPAYNFNPKRRLVYLPVALTSYTFKEKVYRVAFSLSFLLSLFLPLSLLEWLNAM
ncbi:hypothetical protein QOT17_024805 [Balamuthia mandrillaris]